MRITDLTLTAGEASVEFKAVSPQDAVDMNAQWRTNVNTFADRRTIFSNVGPVAKSANQKTTHELVSPHKVTAGDLTTYGSPSRLKLTTAFPQTMSEEERLLEFNLFLAYLNSDSAKEQIISHIKMI